MSSAVDPPELRAGGVEMPPDIAWIEPRFAIGGRPYAAQRPAIRRLGVDVVVTLEPPGPGEVDAWAALGVELAVFPTRDRVAIPASRFAEVVETLLAHHDAGRSLLLHCLAGLNRAPTVAAALLCRRDRLTPDEALARIRAVRPGAAPTPEQDASLRDWAAKEGRRRAD